MTEAILQDAGAFDEGTHRILPQTNARISGYVFLFFPWKAAVLHG